MERKKNKWEKPLGRLLSFKEEDIDELFSVSFFLLYPVA